jgi:hypothetical protein
MPSKAFLLTILFLITLPIPPIPSIARGHFTPSALGFPVALSFIPRSAFTTPTPKSWEVARALQALGMYISAYHDILVPSLIISNGMGRNGCSKGDEAYVQED